MGSRSPLLLPSHCLHRQFLDATSLPLYEKPCCSSGWGNRGQLTSCLDAEYVPAADTNPTVNPAMQNLLGALPDPPTGSAPTDVVQPPTRTAKTSTQP